MYDNHEINMLLYTFILPVFFDIDAELSPFVNMPLTYILGVTITMFTTYLHIICQERVTDRQCLQISLLIK